MSDVKRRKATKRKKRTKYKFSLRFYAIITVLIVVVVGIILSRTVFFNITDITLDGDGQYSQEEILQLAGIEVGDNLFAINTSKQENYIQNTFAYAGDVKIKRKLPSTLLITVTAAIPEKNIYCDDGTYYFVSTEGKVLEKGITEPMAGVPTVYGYEPADTPLCGKISSNGQDKKKLIEELFDAFEQNGFTNLVSVDVTNLNDITVQYNEYQTIQLGTNDELEFKIELAKAIIDKRGNPTEAGAINVKSTEYPAFIGSRDNVPQIVE